MPPAEAPSERSRRLVRSRKRLLAVEGAEVLGLDEVESRAADAVEQRNDLPVSDARAVRPQETAAPVVRAECLGEPGRPDLDPAIADPAELHRLSRERREDLPELFRSALLPVEEDVHPDGLLVRNRAGRRGRGGLRLPGSARVAHGLQLLGTLPHAR